VAQSVARQVFRQQRSRRVKNAAPVDSGCLICSCKAILPQLSLTRLREHPLPKKDADPATIQLDKIFVFFQTLLGASGNRTTDGHMTNSLENLRRQIQQLMKASQAVHAATTGSFGDSRLSLAQVREIRRRLLGLENDSPQQVGEETLLDAEPNKTGEIQGMRPTSTRAGHRKEE
jgi:hypothetical protein